MVYEPEIWYQPKLRKYHKINVNFGNMCCNISRHDMFVALFATEQNLSNNYKKSEKAS